MAEKMRKRSRGRRTRFPNARNDKTLNNQGFVVHKMAEAMGFELMDLLQSTVFKTIIKSNIFNGLQHSGFRIRDNVSMEWHLSTSSRQWVDSLSF